MLRNDAAGKRAFDRDYLKSDEHVAVHCDASRRRVIGMQGMRLRDGAFASFRHGGALAAAC
jgi:hypothetical protein